MAKIDIENASVEELQQIRNSVVRKLAERARNKEPIEALYDRHGSVHSKYSDPVM